MAVVTRYDEIQSPDDAAMRLTTIFGKQFDEESLRQYAQMAAFLSDEGAVRKALIDVSAGVWEEYRQNKYENTPNRFTRAIMRYGEQFGFMCQSNVVFTGPLTSQDFLGHVDNKVLWKDTFAPEHGEFSHTFQWLAAALHFGWKSGTAELYKTSAKIWNVEPVATRNPNNASGQVTKEAKEIPLWAWLVDCFPIPAKSTSPGNVNPICNIFSNTCRTPNFIWKLAKELPSDTLIHYYVRHRQFRLDQAAKKGSTDTYYEIPTDASSGGSKRQDIQAIKSYTSASYEAKQAKGWEGKGATSTFKTGTQVPVPGKSFGTWQFSEPKTTHRVFSRPADAQQTVEKELKEVEFHQKPGRVPQTVFSQQIDK